MTGQRGFGRRGGAVIVMVTIAILVLFAMVGLVLDIGWAYFTRRTAQVAADAAAQAGARRAFELNLNTTSAPNNQEVLDRAFEYAKLNGYVNDGEDLRQKVIITAAPGPYPGTTGISEMAILYYVEATVTKRLSSWFIMTSGAGMDLTSGANAVAAVILGPLKGSILLLNQTCTPDGTDCSLPDVADMGGNVRPGLNLHVGGSGSISTQGGIINNSSANGDARTGGVYSVEIEGNSAFIKSAYMQIAQDGTYKGAPDPGDLGQILGLNNLPKAPFNGPQIADPTLSMNFGKQPPVKTLVQTLADTGGVVYGATGAFSGATLGPGTYVAVDIVGGFPQVSTRGIKITGDVTFSPGYYNFLGGLDIQGGTVTFGEGVYAVVGAQPNANGGAGMAFQVAANSVLRDGGTGTNGELFVLTRPDYGPDSGNPILLDTAMSYLIQPISNTGSPMGSSAVRPFGPLATLGFGQANLQAGQTDNADVLLHGLKNRTPCLPGVCAPGDAELYLYEPMLIWQDRRNNIFRNRNRDAAVMHTQAGTLQGLKGTIYQSRGSLFELQGSDSQTGDAQLITGALDVQGSATINLTAIIDPLLITTVSLVR